MIKDFIEFFRAKIKLILGWLLKRAEDFLWKRTIGVNNFRSHLLSGKGEGPESDENAFRDELERITQGVDDYFDLPLQLSENVEDPNLKAVSQNYFLLKQTLAVYEAYNRAIPIQILNEMRNAVDHHVRGLVQEDPQETEKHFKKMDGHIQRALLDLIKVACAYYDVNIRKRHKFFSRKAIGLVDNGEYIKDFSRLQNEAYLYFVDAKREDFRLGDDQSENDEVKRKYVTALIAHKNLDDFQVGNLYKVRWGAAKHYILKGWGYASAIIIGALGSYLAGWWPTPELREVSLSQFFNYIPFI